MYTSSSVNIHPMHIRGPKLKGMAAKGHLLELFRLGEVLLVVHVEQVPVGDHCPAGDLVATKHLGTPDNSHYRHYRR